MSKPNDPAAIPTVAELHDESERRLAAERASIAGSAARPSPFAPSGSVMGTYTVKRVPIDELVGTTFSGPSPALLELERIRDDLRLTRAALAALRDRKEITRPTDYYVEIGLDNVMDALSQIDSAVSAERAAR